MSDKKASRRLETILKKIGFIEEIVDEYGSIQKALEDEGKGVGRKRRFRH